MGCRKVDHRVFFVFGGMQMIEIRCLKDIADALENKSISEELAKMLRKDLIVIKDYCDEDGEYSIETFHTDYFKNGHIAIVDEETTSEQILELGLTGGLSETIPEAVVNYTINSTKWTRAVVIFNDSFGIILWLKNFNGFDGWELPVEETYTDGTPF